MNSFRDWAQRMSRLCAVIAFGVCATMSESAAQAASGPPAPAGDSSSGHTQEVATQSGGQARERSLFAETAFMLEELAATATEAVVQIEVMAGGESRQGSGFVVDSNGLIVTNYHVIRDATGARVKMNSGDIYDDVAVMATDERRDIAVLKVPGFGLPALEMGNSDSVRIGSAVMAIGSPMGLENTVSTGIVSGRRQEPEGFQLIQITAPASNGSSGGPVLARDGRVIGIATSQFRVGQNLNFAVPINYARGMLAQLDGEPIAVLGVTELASARETTDMAATDGRVNGGLNFNLSVFEDHRLDLRVREVGGAIRQTRITYRRIEDIAGGEPRIERYLQSESTMPRGTIGPPVTVRRERRRSIMSAVDMRPVSARGLIQWEVDGEWRQMSYDLQFHDGRVTGTIQDSTGVVGQVDRELPQGIVLRGMRDIAFGALVADDLVGRSMDLVTFDASTGQVTSDRFDVRRRTTIEVRGKEREAFVVDLASGLTNERAYYTTEVPRRLLRRENGSGGELEEVVGLYMIPGPDGDAD